MRNSLLRPSGAAPGTYGDGSNIPILVVDAEGRVTSASEVAVSGTSGGVQNPSDAYSGRPAASAEGIVFWPTDAATLDRDTGAAYESWGPIYRLNMSKAVADFAWINQETATATDTKNGILMTPPVGTGSSINILKRTAPATPYTITMGGILNAVGTNSLRMGLVFRQSSDGKLVYVAIGYGGSNYKIESFKFSDPTTYSGATYISYEYTPLGGMIWCRIADDGANRITYVSCDGQNWINIHSVTRTDYLTADEIGIAVDCNNASIICVGNFLHYVEA